MNWRERLADRFASRALTLARLQSRGWELQCVMAKHAAKQFESDAFEWNGKALDAHAALRSVLAARNITEARKIARQALGEDA